MPYTLPRSLTREGWLTRRNTIKAPADAEKKLLEQFKFLADTAATVDLDAVEKARVRLGAATQDEMISQVEREVKQEVETDGIRLKMRVETLIKLLLEFTRGWAARGTANEDTAKHFLALLTQCKAIQTMLDTQLRDLKADLATRINRRRNAIRAVRGLTLAQVPGNPKLLELFKRVSVSIGAPENLNYYLLAYKAPVPATVGDARARFDTYMEDLNISQRAKIVLYHTALLKSGASDSAPIGDALATPAAVAVTRKDGAAATTEFRAVWQKSFEEITALTTSNVLYRVTAMDEAVDLFDT